MEKVDKRFSVFVRWNEIWVMYINIVSWFGTRPTEPVNMERGGKIPGSCDYRMRNTSFTN